jgi:hypothetical protein
MTTVSVNMTLPASTHSWYSGSGSITITLYADEVSMHTKKEMLKLALPRTKGTHGTSDNPRGYVVDLNKCQETFSIKGWIEDDASYTAWEKVWMLRAMCTTGGPVGTLTIGDKTFSSSTKEAFLESVIWTISPASQKDIQTAGTNKEIARAYVQLTFVLSEEK